MGFFNKGYPVMSQGNAYVTNDATDGKITSIGNDAGDIGLVTSNTAARVLTTVLAGSRSLTAADNGRRLVYSGGSGITLTVPGGLDSSFFCTVVQYGAGTVTFAGSGAIVSNVSSHTRTSAIYAKVDLMAAGTDTYIFHGATA